jgi:hypothetical protein
MEAIDFYNNHKDGEKAAQFLEDVVNQALPKSAISKRGLGTCPHLAAVMGKLLWRLSVLTPIGVYLRLSLLGSAASRQ